MLKLVMFLKDYLSSRKFLSWFLFTGISVIALRRVFGLSADSSAFLALPCYLLAPTLQTNSRSARVTLCDKLCWESVQRHISYKKGTVFFTGFYRFCFEAKYAEDYNNCFGLHLDSRCHVDFFKLF